MALVLITHDMGVVAETAERVSVHVCRPAGRRAAGAAALRHPRHPYTAALLAALPERATASGACRPIPGMVPGQFDRPTGCLFAPRCAFATELLPQPPPASC
jgi:dipeptide transport system ATP-binding protein